MATYNIDNFHPNPDHSVYHVGLIADGARRYAHRENISLYDSYLLSMQKITEYISMFFEVGISYISIYLSSDKNFKRPQFEIESFCKAGAKFCDSLIPPIAEKYNVRLIPVGRTELVPHYFKDAMHSVQEITKNNNNGVLYLLVAYNPYLEILEAFDKAASPEKFLNNLAVLKPLNVVIRTSGVNLLSNFLPLQSAYARIYVIDKLFNDTDTKNFKDIILSYKSLERAYGD